MQVLHLRSHRSERGSKGAIGFFAGRWAAGCGMKVSYSFLKQYVSPPQSLRRQHSVQSAIRSTQPAIRNPQLAIRSTNICKTCSPATFAVVTSAATSATMGAPGRKGRLASTSIFTHLPSNLARRVFQVSWLAFKAALVALR
eukprot:7578783-Alexandrium_andersonii.AAC.1